MKRLLLVFAVAVVVLASVATVAAARDSIPAAKTVATSSDILVYPNPSGMPGTEILSTEIKTAESKELVITVSAESMLYTSENISALIPSSPSVFSQSTARIVISAWVDDILARPGYIVLNDRTVRLEGKLDSNTWAYQYDSTRSSNSFSFFAVNVPPGVHTVTVKAWREGYLSSGASWFALVGQRTLVVEEARMAKIMPLALTTLSPTINWTTVPQQLTFNGYLWLGDESSASISIEWVSSQSSLPLPPFPWPYELGPKEMTSDGQFSFGPISMEPTVFYFYRTKAVYDGKVLYTPISGIMIGP